MSEVNERTRTAGAADTATVDIEGMARRAGWKPQEEWDGKPEKWAPADKYIDRILSSSDPRMQKRYRDLDARVAASEALNANLSKTMEETQKVMNDFRDYNMRVAETQYRRAKADIEARMEKAVVDADPEAHKKARADLEALENEKPKPAPEPDNKPDVKPTAPASPSAPNNQQQLTPEQQREMSEIAKWNADNPWYNSSKAGADRVSAYAIGLFNEISADPDYADLPIRERLDMVTDECAKLFPTKVKSDRGRPAAAAVSDGGFGSPGGSQTPAGKPGRTFKDLPPDAQEQATRFSKTMVKDPKTGKDVPLVTIEKYLEDYDWS